jgi:DivIVA domain-containing protein
MEQRGTIGAVVTFLTYLFGLVVVCGLLFLVASFAFGRGEELAPMPADGTPVELPHTRPVRGDDVRGLRLSVVLRGYRMAEVDWVLDRLADQLDDQDREIARLRAATDHGPSEVRLDHGPPGVRLDHGPPGVRLDHGPPGVRLDHGPSADPADRDLLG